MWRRSNQSNLGNSAALKYRIAFYPNHQCLYNEISINYYKPQPTIDIFFRLSNPSIHNKLVHALEKKYHLPTWEKTPWIFITLKKLDKNEAENVFDLINNEVPTLLPKNAFNCAVADMLTKVIPTETRVPWGKTFDIFERSVDSLTRELGSQMDEGTITDDGIIKKHDAAQIEREEKKEQEEIDTAEVSQNVPTLSNKEKLLIIIDTLKYNMLTQQNGRKTIRNHEWKVNLLVEIQNKIIREDPKHIDINRYCDHIHKVCAMKRNFLHFWSEPHSVSELTSLINELELEWSPYTPLGTKF